MNIDNEYILKHFPHLFKNENNERKILHSVVDESWVNRYHIIMLVVVLFLEEKDK